MGITRKSLFGFPPRPNQGSQYTQREVPLTQGVQLDQPWPALPPGSSQSMSNFLPLAGVLKPRSRLSSLNTIRTIETINGIIERTNAGAGTPEIWVSGATRHGIVFSTGSISLASFTSANGFGTVTNTTGTLWNYAQTFFPNIGTAGNNGLVAAAGVGASYDTLLALYRDSNAGAAPFYSYLTSAPRSSCVGAFDNYVIAWGISIPGQGTFPTRAQWCVRGNASNWTSEGSGFEDLLEMRGQATAAKAFTDSRLILFTDREIWQGIGATYPAQFQFQALDRQVGCPNPLTIAEMDLGFFFLGSDNALRLLPRDGGPSRIVSPSVAGVLRYGTGTGQSFGIFDSYTRCYHLFLVVGSVRKSLVVNVDTGEWGFMDYDTSTTDAPRRGLAVNQPLGASHLVNEGLYVGNSGGTVFSTNSLVATENGSAVTAFWRSAPIAADLPGNWKQLTEVNIDYRATSLSTLTLKVSQDGGNTWESSGRSVILPSAAVAGRATSQMYVGGAFPALEIKSESTGFELHRLDIGMTLGGRKSG